MKPVPTDPWALQSRIMAALCDDIFDAAARKDSSFPRMEALRSAMIATERKAIFDGETK